MEQDILCMLDSLLNGHRELSKIIYEYKKNIEYEDSKNFHINIKPDKKILNKKNDINLLFNYPYKLKFFELDDLYHNDIYTNSYGLILSDVEELYYIDKIHSKILNPVLINDTYIYYEYDGYLIRYTTIKNIL
tara:strand:- start:693 stop:1091 length:399 start_codon:yes stop_codon:yes gene_type:complete